MGCTGFSVQSDEELMFDTLRRCEPYAVQRCCLRYDRLFAFIASQPDVRTDEDPEELSPEELATVRDPIEQKLRMFQLGGLASLDPWKEASERRLDCGRRRELIHRSRCRAKLERQRESRGKQRSRGGRFKPGEQIVRRGEM